MSGKIDKVFGVVLLILLISLSNAALNSVNQNGSIATFNEQIKQMGNEKISINPISGVCNTTFDLAPLLANWTPDRYFWYIPCGSVSQLQDDLQAPYIVKSEKPPTAGGNAQFSTYFMARDQSNSFIDFIFANGKIISYKEFFNPNDYSNLTVTFPPGTGNIIINYNTGMSYLMTYGEPKITNKSYSDGKVSLMGQNFFNSPDHLNITLDGKDIKSLITSVNHDLIVFKRDIITAEKFAINITVDGINLIASTGNIVFAPTISKISSIPNKGGPITITGTWLFITNPNATVAVDIKMGTIPCKNPRSPDSNGTVLICDIPPGNGSEGRLVPSITINSIPNEMTSVYFEYAVPTVTHYTQQGDKFSFQGESFGTQAITKFLYNPIKKLSVSPSFINTEQELLNVTLPAGACNGKINIVYSTKVSLPIDFKVIPIFSSITQSKTNGSTITITGKYLQALTCEGAKQQISLKSTDSRGFYCSNFRNNEDKLLCDATQGSGANFSVQLNIGDFSTDKFLFSYEPPIVHSVVQHFDKAIIKGENFGNPTILYFNGRNYSFSTFSNSDIQFTIPSDSSEGPLVLEVSGQKSKETLLTFGPVITGFSNMTTAGGLFNIHGYFFGHINNLTSITVGNLLCNDPIVVNNETISCNLQDGSGTNWKLSVIADGKEIPNPNNLLFSFDAPKIESYISYLIGNGSIVTVFGMNYHNPVLVTIGGVECNFPNSTDSNTTTCFLPKFDSDFETPKDGNLTIHILVGGQTTEADIFVFNEAQRNDPPPASKMKWLIPAIVIPCFLALLCAVAVTIILVKRHKKMKELRKLFKN